MRLPPFLPHLKGLRLAEIAASDEDVTLHLYATRRTAPCSSCQHRSHRVHSRYHRTIADLPWSGTPVRLRLRVRRFFCRDATCPQRIFAERLPQLVDRYARRVHRLHNALQRIGLALGGATGARLSVTRRLPAGRTTLLGLLRAAPLPPVGQPSAVGVDEFAWRRGRRFGTVIIDLEHRRPLDLLPDRDADQAAAWLQQHPQIATIARDRSELYADAATRGAPAAQQVVDRWHLLHNLGEALEQFLLHKRTVLRDAAGALAATEPTPSTDPPPAELPPLPWQQRAVEAVRQRHAAQLARYEAIHQLHAAGTDIAHIARTVGVSRETVYRYLRLPDPPAPMRLLARRAALNPYLPYLERRWAEGCRNGKRLWREIREQGFTRSYSAVARFVARFRRVERTANQSTRPGERQHDRRPRARLPCSAPALRRFATGLRADLEAVRAGLTEIWSNGPTEGFVHQRKLRKRQGYGRAGFDLLRQRLLFAV